MEEETQEERGMVVEEETSEEHRHHRRHGPPDRTEERREQVVVKGYMRPDGTSYYVVIPKEIRELLGLKGGEYFVMKARPEKREIELKVARFVEEGQLSPP